MTDREAIDRIKATPIYRWTFEMNKTDQEPCELAKALQCAVNALEMKIPKKPKKGGVMGFDGDEGAYCPNCGLDNSHWGMRACVDCGQVLDWW